MCLVSILVLLSFSALVHCNVDAYNEDLTPEIDSFKEHGPDSSYFCKSASVGGIGWLMHIRKPDYGWDKDTPRAVITLVVNKWMTSAEQDVRQMELQLDVELTKTLLRNASFPMPPNELALYIQALVSIGRNPRDFHGIDLVSDLLYNVDSVSRPHPYLVLALCDTGTLRLGHLVAIRRYLEVIPNETKTEMEMKALALKAFACAASLQPSFAKFKAEMTRAAKSLIERQRADGSFGNLYTTALVTQALIASNTTLPWHQEAALEFLHATSLFEQSVLGIYATELALKASIYPFVKDIHAMPTGGLQSPDPDRQLLGPRLHYTVRNDLRPDVQVTITIRVPVGSNFFDVMKRSMDEDPNFRFSYYYDDNRRPFIYAVDDVPNDAEENFFWRLCRQQRMHEKPHESYMHTIHTSPVLEMADSSHHFVLWYRNTPCEKENEHSRNSTREQ